jgi:hypothetical protein
MSKKLFPLLMVAALSQGGCSLLHPSSVSEHWGQSVEQNADQQITNPEGSAPDNDPGAFADGTTTTKDMNRLRTRQTKQPATGGPLESMIDKADR